MEKTIEPIIAIQKELRAPKTQYNKYGNYKYRSSEDIIEALKPIIHSMDFWLKMEDKVIDIGGRIYVEATVTLTNGSKTYEAKAYAREDKDQKGMVGSQITGASSSYARKYALNGLLAIDDNKDADKTNEPAETVKKPILKNGMEKWDQAIAYAKKGGDMDTIYNNYTISEEDINELQKNVPSSTAE